MTMTSALVVIDRPFRGVVEREFADAVHLARVCSAQLDDVSILLTGEAVLLATAPVRPAAALGTSHDVAASLRAAAEGGMTVLLDSACAAAFGVDGAAPWFQPASPGRIAEAATTHDHVWFA